MRKERKHFTPEEKVAILRRHLLDKVSVSELCEELGLRPTVFYRWQKELFENGAAAFQSQERPQRQVEEKQKRVEFLEQKARTKDEVLAELMAEYIALKKFLGNLTGNWVPPDVRDQVVDFVRRWSERAEISVGRFIHWLGVAASKFYDWGVKGRLRIADNPILDPFESLRHSCCASLLLPSLFVHAHHDEPQS